MKNFMGLPVYDTLWEEQMRKLAEANRQIAESRQQQMERQYLAEEKSRQEFRKSVADEVVKAIGPLIQVEVRLATKFIVDEIMATKVKATIKDGKVKPKDTTPAPLRKGKAMKAARTEKGLKANREKRK